MNARATQWPLGARQTRVTTAPAASVMVDIGPRAIATARLPEDRLRSVKPPPRAIDVVEDALRSNGVPRSSRPM
jgi:hypothetical protein